MRFVSISIMAGLMVLLSFCKAKDPVVQNNTKEETPVAEVSYAGEPTVIYKTKADYSQYVPVTMNAAKTEIVAYPATLTDLKRNGKPAYPTALTQGYCLDNRGIGPNSVFLKMTYTDYMALDEAPKLADMMNMIIDKDPFTEIYNLGDRSRFKDEVKEINELIEKGALKKFKQLK
jgi:hypothetical protein